MKLVLASTSPYRKAVLQKLGIPFETVAPDVDETRQPDETAEQLVIRLSGAKAKQVAKQHPDCLIIGSDQVAVIGNDILGKPGNFENAFKQLKAASGKTVSFLTGLCLYNSESQNVQSDVVAYNVTFKKLKDNWIKNYLKKDNPYNSAGSFKSEGLGIALFEKMEGTDPNALIGLPLIRLVDMLNNEGFEILA